MAEFHNFSELKVRHLLESELLDIRNELLRVPGYDPAESLADNVRLFVDVAQTLACLHRDLRAKYQELKKEQENDKNVARSYPIAGDSGICGVDASQTNTQPRRNGFPASYPHGSYTSCGEFVPGDLLGSTDGYGR